MQKQSNIRILTECAVFVAMATVLSLLKVWEMPLGGSITICSMLPICIVSLMHGLRWGMLSSFVFSLFQLFFGITMSGLLGWGLTPVMLIGCILLDYILPFTVLGIAGVFRKKGTAGIYAGLVLAFVLNFFFHFLSGYVIFAYLDQWEIFGSTFTNAPILYSICYNAFYMLPELIISVIVFAILSRIPVIKNKITSK